jgi:hypothetical protein
MDNRDNRIASAWKRLLKPGGRYAKTRERAIFREQKVVIFA